MNISNLNKAVKNTFSALSHRNFRLFWFGQCISLIGTWMQNIGQAWLVLQLTQSSFKLGLVTAVQFLPMMILSLFAGTLVDRLPKKKVLLFTQTGLMILAATLATLTYFNMVRYWHILMLALFLGLINTLDMPTRQSFFIELVGKKDLMNAIALNSTIFNLARVLGPAVAGFLIGLLGIAVCFYLNALSFLAVIGGIYMMDITYKNENKKVDMAPRHVFRDIGEGLKYMAANKIVLLPLVLLALLSCIVMNYNVLVPSYAKQNLGQQAVGYGFLMTSMGLGSLVGALTLAARSKRGPRVPVLLAGAAGMSLFLSVTGFSTNYLLACLFLLTVGFCSIIFSASVNTMIQLNSADNMRGRVMSMYSLVFGGVTPIGSLYSGKLTEYAGAPLCMAISGIAGLVAVTAIGILFYRGIKNGTVNIARMAPSPGNNVPLQ